MIRTVRIPLRGRMGVLEISQGCVSYFDPVTGDPIADANTSAACQQAAEDAATASAVADMAAANQAAANSLALNSGTSASSILATSLFNVHVAMDRGRRRGDRAAIRRASPMIRTHRKSGKLGCSPGGSCCSQCQSSGPAPMTQQSPAGSPWAPVALLAIGLLIAKAVATR
jgi:hypothetical protein